MNTARKVVRKIIYSDDYNPIREYWEAIKYKPLFAEIEKIEDEIAALEEEISAIDKECAKPENAVNSAKLNELAARQQECRERLETCYETWEDLSMQLDGAKDS